ncbi:MAG: hypothetical protein EB088_15455 [Betaproteobacteria bacterium]|nr:hypothetical protein [Betaproteobacteria bacterium]
MLPSIRRHLGIIVTLIGIAFTLPAFAQYKASYTVLREHVRVDVKADGSHRYQLERLIRIDTPQGVDNEGEQRFGYVGSLELCTGRAPSVQKRQRAPAGRLSALRRCA